MRYLLAALAFPTRRLALWVFRNEWIPLGLLTPYVLGWGIGSMGRRVKDGE